jgi:nicotinamide-nucleotide amidase
MFTDHICPYLEKLQDSTLYYKMIRTVGIGESDLETALLDIIDRQTDPTIATYVKDFSAMVRVASKRKTLKEAQDAVEETVAQIRDRIGQYIYSEDNEDLAQAVLRIMKGRGLTLSAAESITGGMFAKLFTDIPGSSSVLNRSIVTYSNAAKISELGVKPETLDKYGAVSHQTAEEMVRGLSLCSGSDICVSVTGHAGPDTGDGLPVGLFYVGLCAFGKVTVKEYHARRTKRDDVRKLACQEMYRLIYEVLK